MTKLLKTFLFSRNKIAYIKNDLNDTIFKIFINEFEERFFLAVNDYKPYSSLGFITCGNALKKAKSLKNSELEIFLTDTSINNKIKNIPCRVFRTSENRRSIDKLLIDSIISKALESESGLILILFDNPLGEQLVDKNFIKINHVIESIKKIFKLLKPKIKFKIHFLTIYKFNKLNITYLGNKDSKGREYKILSKKNVK